MSTITHPRTLIRRSIRDRLKQATVAGETTTYPTPAGSRVYAPFDKPASPDNLPAILAYTDEETVQGELYQDEPRRVLIVALECQASAKSEVDLDDLLDELELAAYYVVMKDHSQGGQAQDTAYQSTGKERKHEGNVFYGKAVVKFQVEYGLPEPSSDDLDDFLKFHAEYDLAPSDGTIDATDEVTLPGPE